jgi:uncharacterized membrane protein
MNASVWVVSLLFGVAGVMHFVLPRPFEAIVPPWLPSFLPNARTLVYASGVVEILAALGVLLPATRVLAGWTLLALLVAVFPANVYMLMAARAAQAAPWWIAALWMRLPLQPLLMWWVWRVAVRT